MVMLGDDIKCDYCGGCGPAPDHELCDSHWALGAVSELVGVSSDKPVEEVVEQVKRLVTVKPFDHRGGFVVIDGERWWSEGVLRAAEDRILQAREDERRKIVAWLRSVGSGPAELLADQIVSGAHLID